VTEKLKIAFVTGGLPFGGSTTFLLYLASGLQSLGISSEIHSFTRENSFATDFASAGIPVHVHDETKLIFEDRLMAIYRRMAAFKPTVVLANLGAEAFEMLRYVPAGTARMGMIHDPGNQGLPPLYRDCLDGVVVVNPAWAEVTRRLVPGLTCQYLAHGIPLPEANLMRNPHPAGPLSLTYFGRLTEVKGARLFPEITRQLCQRSIPFHWAIYGGGPEEGYVRQALAAEIQAGLVALHPQVSRHELFPTIRKHDVFILASEVEGGPLTLLEAMALGLVPICNDIPCLIQEVVTSENGFIIARDPVKYAETFALLHHNRPQLERLSAAARKTITGQYSTRAMAERYVQFMNTIAPAAVSGSWPARISPKPMRNSSLVPRLTQSTGFTRQLRRIVKRMRG
jgi:colanic acid/amylovoran biosynthesis glycosyltransferase